MRFNGADVGAVATRSGGRETYAELARSVIRSSDGGCFRGEFTREMADELFAAIRANPIVRVPSDFALVARAFSLLAGIAHTLGVRANALDAMGPSGSSTRPESLNLV